MRYAAKPGKTNWGLGHCSAQKQWGCWTGSTTACKSIVLASVTDATRPRAPMAGAPSPVPRARTLLAARRLAIYQRVVIAGRATCNANKPSWSSAYLVGHKRAGWYGTNGAARSCGTVWRWRGRPGGPPGGCGERHALARRPITWCVSHSGRKRFGGYGSPKQGQVQCAYMYA